MQIYIEKMRILQLGLLLVCFPMLCPAKTLLSFAVYYDSTNRGAISNLIEETLLQYPNKHGIDDHFAFDVKMYYQDVVHDFSEVLEHHDFSAVIVASRKIDCVALGRYFMLIPFFYVSGSSRSCDEHLDYNRIIYMLPPDGSLMSALFQAVKQYQWNSAGVLYDENDEVQFTFQDIQTTRESGLDFVAFEAGRGEENIRKTLVQARRKGLRTYVLVTSYTRLIDIMEVARKLELSTSNYHWFIPNALLNPKVLHQFLQDGVRITFLHSRLVTSLTLEVVAEYPELSSDSVRLFRKIVESLVRMSARKMTEACGKVVSLSPTCFPHKMFDGEMMLFCRPNIARDRVMFNSSVEPIIFTPSDIYIEPTSPPMDSGGHGHKRSIHENSTSSTTLASHSAMTSTPGGHEAMTSSTTPGEHEVMTSSTTPVGHEAVTSSTTPGGHETMTSSTTPGGHEAMTSSTTLGGHESMTSSTTLGGHGAMTSSTTPGGHGAMTSSTTPGEHGAMTSSTTLGEHGAMTSSTTPGGHGAMTSSTTPGGHEAVTSSTTPGGHEAMTSSTTPGEHGAMTSSTTLGEHGAMTSSTTPGGHGAMTSSTTLGGHGAMTSSTTPGGHGAMTSSSNAMEGHGGESAEQIEYEKCLILEITESDVNPEEGAVEESSETGGNGGHQHGGTFEIVTTYNPCPFKSRYVWNYNVSSCNGQLFSALDVTDSNVVHTIEHIHAVDESGAKVHKLLSVGSSNGQRRYMEVTYPKFSVAFVDMPTRPIRLGVIFNPPWLSWDVDENGVPIPDTYEGFLHDVINELAINMGFNFTINEESAMMIGAGNNYTDQQLEKEMNILFEADKCDIFLYDQIIRGDRISLTDTVDISNSLQVLLMYFLTKREEKNENVSIWQFLAPFQTTSWLVLWSSLVMVSMLMAYINKNNPYEFKRASRDLRNGAKHHEHLGFLNAMWFNFATLVEQSSQILPRSTSLKILSGTWWFFVMLVVASYTANMISFMTQIINEGITTPEQLASQNEVGYGFLPDNPMLVEFLPRAKDAPYSTMWTKVSRDRENSILQNFDEALARIRNEKYILIASYKRIVNALQMSCDYEKVGDGFYKYQTGLPLKKGLIFQAMLNDEIARLRDIGKLKTLESKWFGEVEQRCIPENTNALSSDSSGQLDIKAFIGMYVFLTLGVFGGIVFCLAETFYVKYGGFRGMVGSANKYNLRKDNNEFLRPGKIMEEEFKDWPGGWEVMKHKPFFHSEDGNCPECGEEI